MEDEDAAGVLPVEDPARRLDELTDMAKDTLNQRARLARILWRNAGRDGIEVAQGRCSPDYFSDRPMRRFASAWGTLRGA